MAKMLPYGLTDFIRIRHEDYYYVDKTRYIELIERMPSFLFLLRPRRFGKSLFLTMLETYYDLRYADRFEELFGDLYIGKHPTRLHNQYLVLRFNFSAVNDRLEEIEESFNKYCCMVMRTFVWANEKVFGKEVWDTVNRDETKPGLMLSAIERYAAAKGGIRIYLLIDEYDNFTNAILSSYGKDRYRSVTHGDGFIRSFFNAIKVATTAPGASLERLFITGVSPITMDDVTSGFNIGTNVSMDADFNNVVGFSELEVREMLAYYKKEGVLEGNVNEVLEVMKPWYDNYCFSPDCLDKPMYNSDMTLYFLNNYMRLKKVPNPMIDQNIRTDYNKLRHVIELDKTFGENASVVQEIIAKGSIATELATSFPVERIVETSNFKSLLFYFGLLSIRSVKMGKTVLEIPNLTVREQMYTYLAEAYRKAGLFSACINHLSELVGQMAYQGEWLPVFRFFADELQRQSTIRGFIDGEAHVKGFLLAYLGLTRGYVICPEYEASKGYADFYMMPDLLHQPDIAYSYIIEVKYLRREATDTELSKVKQEASEQLLRYAADTQVQRTKGDTRLCLITLIFKGWELVEMSELRRTAE